MKASKWIGALAVIAVGVGLAALHSTRADEACTEVQCIGRSKAAGQVCPVCVTRHSDLSDAQKQKLQALVLEYNKKIESAQKELLEAVAKDVGKDAAKKLARNLHPQKKKEPSDH